MAGHRLLIYPSPQLLCVSPVSLALLLLVLAAVLFRRATRIEACDDRLASPFQQHTRGSN